MGERASLSSSQKKSYSLLLWKWLPRLLVILNKQNGLDTKKELSMPSVEFWKSRRFVFLEGHIRWLPLWLGRALQLTAVSLTEEHFQGSQHKADSVGATLPLPGPQPPERMLVPFQRQRSPTTSSLSDHSNIWNAPNGIRRAKKQVTSFLLSKGNKSDKTKTGKNTNWHEGNICNVKPYQDVQRKLYLEEQSALPQSLGLWTAGMLFLAGLWARMVFVTNDRSPDGTDS